MNAGKRWAYHFVSELECVKCRRKGDLTLYDFSKNKVDSESFTPWELKEKVPHMDVWCSQCTPKINTRVTGNGRLLHKQEAARMADVRTGIQIASHYDTYRLRGKNISRQQLVEYVKHRPCGVCGSLYPSFVMVIYNKDGSFQEMHDFVESLESSIVVCRNCEAYLKAVGKAYEPNIVLDENFWQGIESL